MYKWCIYNIEKWCFDLWDRTYECQPLERNGKVHLMMQLIINEVSQLPAHQHMASGLAHPGQL